VRKSSLSPAEVGKARRRSLKEHGRIFWAGVAVFAAMLVNLFLAVSLYPTRYVNGVVCACGRPGWVTYWTLAIYVLVVLGGVLLIAGLVWIERHAFPAPHDAQSAVKPPEEQQGGGGDA
jgi:hypothetical protein